MGVNLTELMHKKEISLAELSGKVIVIDAQNHLYQFLSTIRAKDGSLLRDSSGQVTSHLIGLFSRTTSLMTKNISIIYVFDGVHPELKRAEISRRVGLKQEAQRKYDAALEQEDIENMKKYAAQTSRLTPEMVQEAKKLIAALGLPCIQAPSEGEAQAAQIVKNNDAYAIASQDADSLLFGASRTIRYLSITGRKKVPGKLAYSDIMPELVDLKETLHQLNITQDQLIVLSILTGTDFNPGGIKGIGPKKALMLVKKYPENFNAIFREVEWKNNFDVEWEKIFELFKNMPVTLNYELTWRKPDPELVSKILIEQHDFSRERVEKTLNDIFESSKSKPQQALNKWF